MNDGMLSQDEINELLKGLNDDGENDDEEEDAPEVQEVDIAEYLSDIEQDTLGEIGNISFGSAATALSTLLNQKVEITTPHLSLIIKDELEKEFPQPHVAVHVEYTEGFEGVNILVIQSTDAAIIADLMLGGNGLTPETELNEMHLSAIQEAMNQMMGSASTSMSTIFNKKVDISPPGIDVFDFNKDVGLDNVPEENYLVKISFRLKVGELIDSNIMQLVTVPFAKSLVYQLMNPSGEEQVAEMSGQVEQAATAVDESEQSEVMEEVQPPRQEQQAKAPIPPPPQQEQPPRRENVAQARYDEREVNVQPAAFASFDEPRLSPSESHNLNMLLDIPLEVTVELGRTKRSIKEILEYNQGSIIELDKLAGEHIDILVNQKLIAKGEVVVIDENFGVRITDIVSQEDRIQNLK